jgi:hypothetical protein
MRHVVRGSIVAELDKRLLSLKRHAERPAEWGLLEFGEKKHFGLHTSKAVLVVIRSIRLRTAIICI